jgi:hypothetical protein
MQADAGGADYVLERALFDHGRFRLDDDKIDG